MALLEFVAEKIERALGKDYDEMGDNQGATGNQRATPPRPTPESLYASQNNPVRETGRTLMEMLNE